MVYELLNARTTAQIISEDPSRIPEISGLPNRKEKLLKWVDSLSAFITEAEAEKIKHFIRGIPDRDTFLHGDFNAKNIMVRDGEFQLIDIGDAAIVHPVFDVAGLMLVYIIIPASRGGARSDDDLKRLLGFDFEYAPKVWGLMCGTYFGLSDPRQIGEVTQKLMPYCLLMMTFQAISTRGEDAAGIRVRVDRVLRDRLLPAIDAAQPLEF